MVSNSKPTATAQLQGIEPQQHIMMSSASCSQEIADASYAEAMAEIDEGRTDKGLWARCFAESAGDEGRARAAYLAKRAVVVNEDVKLRQRLNGEKQAAADANRKLLGTIDEVKQLTADAENGKADALFKLGMMHLKKSAFVDANIKTALDLLVQASMLGHPDAQFNLATMYWDGLGMPRNFQWALAWCEVAAKKNAEARHRVGFYVQHMNSHDVTAAEEICAQLLEDIGSQK